MKRNRIFLSLGIVLLVSVFILFTNIGKNRVVSYAGETLTFLKEKCRDFDGLLGSVEGDQSKEAVRTYVEGLLTDSQLEMKGVILICNKERVLCSNYGDYRGRELDKAPFISEIKEGAQPGKLLSLRYYGSSYYGSMDHEGDYDLYVFYPSEAVFHLRSIALFYGVSLYAFFGLLFSWIRTREEKEQAIREMACQDKILISASKEERANAAKSDLLKRLNYDIHMLVNDIRGSLEMGDQYDQDLEKQRQIRKKVWDTSQRLLELLSDMVDLDRLESGTVVLEERSFDLRKLLDEVKQWAEPIAKERGILFCSREPEGNHWRVYGSPVHLKEILTHIVESAIKDNRDGDQVTFFCREIGASGRKARFEFVCTDTRSSYRKNEQGLAAAMGLTRLMKGEFHFSHDEGDQAFCRVRLTFIMDEEKKEEEKHPASVHGQKILLVEDNELNMEIAEFILRKEGMQVIKAWNGKEALERFKASAPGEIQVILMDLVMPVMDGFKASQKIRELEREDAKKVAIIALTASSYEEDVEKCRQAGMNEHLTKPLDAGNLIRVIHKYRKGLS